jgi:hypothetical protein
VDNEWQQNQHTIAGLWDIIIVGGITGAGILREVAGLVMHCWLNNDFAWEPPVDHQAGSGVRCLEGSVLTVIPFAETTITSRWTGLIDELGFLMIYIKEIVWQIDMPWVLQSMTLALRWDHGYCSPQVFRAILLRKPG